jgi:dTDP-L-rhamnose 4-epimerase
MKKILVTGGAGLIGSHIVDLLHEKNYDVKILDNLEKVTHLNGKPEWITDDTEFILGDIRNKKDWEKALLGVDAVFHEAAWGGFAPEISKMTETNITGVALMFEAIREKKYPVKKIVVASSQAVYGEGKYRCRTHGNIHPPLRSVNQLQAKKWEVKCPRCRKELKPLPIDEDTTLDVTGAYSISKLAEEKLSIALGKEFNIPTVALRYSLTYGPRQSIFNPYTGICSIFSMQILQNNRPIVYEDGKQTRDFTFVKDVAMANVFVLENKNTDYQVFNVGTGKGTCVSDFAMKLAKIYNKKSMRPLFTGEFRCLDLRHLTTDNKKLVNLGWKPKYSLDQGLGEYAQWIMKQNKPEIYFKEALSQLRKMGVVRKTK